MSRVVISVSSVLILCTHCLLFSLSRRTKNHFSMVGKVIVSIISYSSFAGFCIQGGIGFRFCGFSCDFLFGLLLLAVVAATLIQNPIRGEL